MFEGAILQIWYEFQILRVPLGGRDQKSDPFSDPIFDQILGSILGGDGGKGGPP